MKSAYSGEAEDSRLKDAVQEGNIQNVQAALDAGADLSFSFGRYRSSVLGTAVFLVCYEDDETRRNVFTAVVKLLVGAGALKGWHGDVLYAPVAQGNIPMLKYLIANGANVSAKIEGLSLAEIAIKNSQDEAYQTLFKEGAVPVSTNSVALLRLVHAASNWDIDAMQIQVDAGADINGVIPDGETPLTASISLPIFKEAQYKGVEWLLNKGADPNRESKILNRAILMGSFPAKDKVKNKVRADTSIRIIKLLLRMGAKVSGTDIFGDTPLHVASKSNYLDAAKLLIKEGAKVMPKNKAGKTPLDLAESKDMIQLLKASGAKEQIGNN
jgi:ankyrin repeat protein